MFKHWRVVKIHKGCNPWLLQSKTFFEDQTYEWETLSSYPSRKAAIHVGMIMRDRGEPISWPGGAVRMGIALVEPCKQEA